MPQIIAPDQLLSSTFEVAPGQQLTLTADGLQGTDSVVVEVITMTAGMPAGNVCCPGIPALPEVTAAVPLRCANGARVILTATYPFAVISGPVKVPLRVRVVMGDPSATITVDLTEYPAAGGCCAECREPYSASYPLDNGGYGFIAGDLIDPEATIEASPCGGTGPVLHLYPTPRPGASAPQYDCAGVLVGYGMNNSATAMVVPPRVPCAT